MTSTLDRIAEELEKIDPKLSLALDKISDVIERSEIASSLNERSIKPIREKIDLSKGVTIDIRGDMVTVVRKPNAVLFALEDDGKQTSAGYIDLLHFPEAKKMSDKQLAQFYWDNIGG
jgi:hypothetical protein